jgi:drug/metabolite transporter (DMT)-like permease
VVLGIIGVTVLVGGNPIALNTEILLAVAASLFAAFSYGMGTVYASRNISGKMSGIHATIGQMLGAALVLAVPAATSIPPAMPSSNAIWAFLALTLVCTCFAYLIYFYLLQNVGPTRTASVTFLVPVFGTFWGILFNKDPYNLWMFLGMAIIFASVGLVMGLRFGKAKVAEAA